MTEPICSSDRWSVRTFVGLTCNNEASRRGAVNTADGSDPPVRPNRKGAGASLPIEQFQDLLHQREITATGCWEWAGRRDPNGYGWTRWQGKKIRVHRLVAHLIHGLELANSREYARHSCDNPPCFNPEHLMPGTPTDNQQDAIRRARRIRAACKRGHPFVAENVAYDGAKGRRCRTCDNDRKRAYEQRQRDKGVLPSWKQPTTCSHCGLLTNKNYIGVHIRRRHPEDTGR